MFYLIVGPLNFLVLQVKKSLEAKLNEDKREAWGDESGAGHQNVGGAKEGELKVFLEAAYYFVHQCDVYPLLLYWLYNEILCLSKRCNIQKGNLNFHPYWTKHRTATRIVLILLQVSVKESGKKYQRGKRVDQNRWHKIPRWHLHITIMILKKEEGRPNVASMEILCCRCERRSINLKDKHQLRFYFHKITVGWKTIQCPLALS